MYSFLCPSPICLGSIGIRDGGSVIDDVNGCVSVSVDGFIVNELCDCTDDIACIGGSDNFIADNYGCLLLMVVV